MIGESFKDGMVLMEAENAIVCVSELNSRRKALLAEIANLEMYKARNPGCFFNQIQKHAKEIKSLKNTTSEIYVFDKVDRDVFLPLQNRLHDAINDCDALLKAEIEKFECESG
jgi:hypothetical protein